MHAALGTLAPFFLVACQVLLASASQEACSGQNPPAWPEDETMLLQLHTLVPHERASLVQEIASPCQGSGKFLAKGEGDDNFWRCLQGGYCIPEAHRCNGVKECRDGSDETLCMPLLPHALEVLEGHVSVAMEGHENTTASLSEVEQQAKTLKMNLNETQTTAEKTKSDVQQLQNITSRLQENMTKLESIRVQLRDNTTELQADVQNESQQINTTDVAVDKLQNATYALQQNFNNLTSSTNKLTLEMQRLEDRLKTVEEQVKKKETR